ncbi:MAG: rRNA pseudouridine synthase [Campylobacterales bacterium]
MKKSTSNQPNTRSYLQERKCNAAKPHHEKKEEGTSRTIRLNKLVALRARCSRRDADKLIEAGRIKVDGAIAHLGMIVSEKAKITLDGRLLAHNEESFTVIVYNKPKGELVAKHDPRGRKTIYDSLPSGFKHFKPVGRLDFASEGLLLLSDSPKVVTALMHSQLERIYLIKIDGPVTEAMITAMKEGLSVDDASAGAHPLAPKTAMTFTPFVAFMIKKNGPTTSKLKVIITEGQNRELRRFFGHFKRKVLDLKRVEYGGITLNALPTGKWRYLDAKEYQSLRSYLKERES